jgi:filamentous hemagglutinin family protein
VKPQFRMQILGQITAIALSSNYAILAQVVPDETLPMGERSQVSGDFNTEINGGAVRGSNLFHSFQQFSIPTGGSAFFNNSATITNIISRVTGSSISNIDGLIRANGKANLFLINPNGILFGPNASLNLGGSFIASTANSVVFDNGFAFSATDPQAPPLLTVNVPVGLQYGSNPGAIQSQGASLQASNGQTLTLAGGVVNIDGGELLALGGRVELAGVAAPGEIGLTQQGQEWRLSVSEGMVRADVAIGNNAIVDVRAGGGGSIAITARNFTTGAGTGVLAGIAAGLGTVGTQAGDIDINTTETVNLNAGRVLNTVLPGGTGNAGNIRISTRSLSSTNGGVVTAVTAGNGNAGNITITAKDGVYIDGLGGISSQVNFIGIGQGGNVRINTGVLSLANGGIVDASTQGQGNAGNITIVARDWVSSKGVGSDGFSSGIYSLVSPRGVGQGGNISITAGSISSSNGGIITTSAQGQGNAGTITLIARDAVSFDGVGSNVNSSGAFSDVRLGARGQGGDIIITTGVLSLTNGGIIGVATQGQGNAGTITITARDAVSFDGVGSNGNSSGTYSSVFSPGVIGQGGDISIATGILALTNGGLITASTVGQGDAGTITITARDSVSFDGVGSNTIPSGAYSTVESGAVGQGRTIRVNTNLFSITSKGVLSASSEGQGDAGNLEVNARQLHLDNQGSIQAETASGQGGNIRLQVQDYLLLRRGSSISTTAGTAQAGGDGGNITFNGNFIVAIPNENSNINANAFTGKGGRVEITAQGIFGIQSRPQETPLSDITASSEFGISGTITLNTPDVNPSQGIVTLPTGLVDTNALIANSCIARSSRQGSFTIAGSGGLAASPDDLANSSFPTYELVPDVTRSPTTNSSPAQRSSQAIVESDGIYRLSNGEVVLGRSCR